MEAADFMPDEADIAGIKSNLAAYEAERASAYRQVRWRVPLFVGLVLVFVALVAWLFNRIADPYEQWFSTPHVFLYVVGFVAAILLYFQAIKPTSTLQHRKTLLPIIFGFIRDMRYEHDVTPIRSTGCRARRSALSAPSASTTSYPVATRDFRSSFTKRISGKARARAAR